MYIWVNFTICDFAAPGLFRIPGKVAPALALCPRALLLPGELDLGTAGLQGHQGPQDSPRGQEAAGQVQILAFDWSIHS